MGGEITSHDIMDMLTEAYAEPHVVLTIHEVDGIHHYKAFQRAVDAFSYLRTLESMGHKPTYTLVPYQTHIPDDEADDVEVVVDTDEEDD